jgi:hypothetical protein
MRKPQSSLLHSVKKKSYRFPGFSYSITPGENCFAGASFLRLPNEPVEKVGFERVPCVLQMLANTGSTIASRWL